MDDKTISKLLNLTYINVDAQKRAKKADWLANVEALHVLLDSAGIPRGDGKGAFTLYHRINMLITILRSAKTAIRAHVDECNDAMCGGESVPDFSALAVWLKQSDKLKLGE